MQTTNLELCLAFKQFAVDYPNAMGMRKRWSRVFHRFLRHTSSNKRKKKSRVPGKVQTNAKKVGGQGEEVLQTLSFQSGWKRILSESRGLLHLCVSLIACVCVYVCKFNHVPWLEARPKISGSTIVTLMQSGTVATTGPMVNSKEPSIILHPFLFLLRITTLKHSWRLDTRDKLMTIRYRRHLFLLRACLSHSNLGNYTGQ